MHSSSIKYHFITVHIDRQRHRVQQIGKNITWHKSLSASERASNEQIRPLSTTHGAQSDKDTLQTGNQGPSKQEAHTNGPTKCDRGLNCAHAPPHPTPPRRLLRRRDMDKPYPPRGEGRKGRGSACRDTPREGRAGGYAKGRDMCALPGRQHPLDNSSQWCVARCAPLHAPLCSIACYSLPSRTTPPPVYPLLRALFAMGCNTPSSPRRDPFRSQHPPSRRSHSCCQAS